MHSPRRTAIYAVAVASLSLAFLGCQSRTPVDAQPLSEPLTTSAPEKAQPPADAAPKPATTSTTVAGSTSAQHKLAYPTGSEATSVLLVEKITPEEVAVGKPFDYTIVVTNLTEMELVDVRVTDQLSSEFRVLESQPALESFDNLLATWNLGKLSSHEKRSIQMRGQVDNTGILGGCTKVSYNTQICSAIAVVEPVLQLTVETPADALLCEDIPVKYKLTNLGTGHAKNVVLTHMMPDNMRHAEGDAPLVFNVEHMAPGQTETFATNLKALISGNFTHKVEAKGEGGYESHAIAETNVTHPVLKVTCEGRTEQFLGRPIRYKIHVENTGSGVARNCTIEHTLPDGTDFLAASDNGRLTADRVVWKLGELAPGASKDLTVGLRLQKIGELQNMIQARADCASTQVTFAKTSVRGISAILLEVVDVSDPTEVGGQETYVISVSNQGTANGTGIQIKCSLEDSMEYVESTGPTQATVEGRTVTFASLAELGPKKEATWTVVVRAAKEGDVRFKVQMDTDQTRRPVLETEATTFYD